MALKINGTTVVNDSRSLENIVDGSLSGNLTITANTVSTSSTTGALVVSGGLGVAGNIYAAKFVGDGSSLTGVAAGTATTAAEVSNAAQPNITSVGTLTSLTVSGTSNLAVVNANGLVRLSNTTVSSSSTSGALVVTGGVGVGGQLFVAPPTSEGSNVAVFGTSAAGSSFSDYSLQIMAGNPGVFSNSARLFVGTGAGTTGQFDFKPWSTSAPTGYISVLAAGQELLQIGGTSSAAGARVSVVGAQASTSAGTGALVVTSNGGLGVAGNINVDGSTNKFGGGTASTSTTSGVVQVTGGIGVSGNVYAGAFYGNGAGLTGISASSATSATTAQTVSNAAQPNITSVGTLSSLTVTGNVSAGNVDGTRGAFTNLAGTLETADQPNITSVGTLSNLTVSGISNIAALNSNGLVRFSNTTVSTNSTTGALVVTGGVGVGGQLNVSGWTTISPGGLIVDNPSALATSTTTGSLQVSGGASVDGNLWVSRSIVRAGDTGVNNWGITGVGFRAPAATYTDWNVAANAVVSSRPVHALGVPTVAADNANVTSTTASTLYIAGAPTAGSNVTITNSYALEIASGNVLIADTSASSNTTTGALRVAGGVGVAGNVYAAAFFGNGAGLTGLAATSSTTAETVSNAAQPNITSVGTLSSLTVTGNVSAGNVSGTRGAFTNLAGTLETAAQPNITSVGTLSSLTVTGNVSAGNVSGTRGAFTNLAGTLETAAQPNITSTGTLTTLTVSGTSNLATLNSNGVVTLSNATASTSAGTGALVISTGGAGIGGNLFVGGAVTIAGNLTVNGTTTTINSSAISVDDINVILGDTASPTDTTANGGGITLKGATDKTITWVQSTGRWTSNQPFEATTFSGSGALLTAIPAGNISGTVSSATSAGSATTAATVTTNAQPNITSVGTLSSLTVTGNVSAGNVSGTLLTGNVSSSGTSSFSTATFSTLANVTASTASTSTGSGALRVTGGAGIGGNVYAGAFYGAATGLTSIPGGNVTGAVSSATSAGSATTATSATTAQTVTNVAQPNITSVGTLTSLTVSGATTFGNATSTMTVNGPTTFNRTVTLPSGYTVSGNDISGMVLRGTPSQFTISAAAGNYFGDPALISTDGPTIVASNAITVQGDIASIRATVPSIGANISFASGRGAYAGFFSGNVKVSASGSASTSTSSGALRVDGGVGVTGNVYAAAFYGSGANLTGITATTATSAGSATTAATVTTAAQPNITSVGTLSSLTVTGNVSAGNVSGTLLTGNVSSSGTSSFSTATFSTLANVTASTASTSTTTGAFRVTGGAGIGGNVYAGAFYGAATGLTSIPAANISGTVASATSAGTVTTAAQPNITSVGTLSSLTVTGNVSAGNVSGTLLTGNVSSSGTSSFSTATFSTLANVTASTASTSTTTGAFRVTGGAGIAGNINVGGTRNTFTGNTASTSTTTGTVVVTGGVGVSGNVHAALFVGNVTGTASQAKYADLAENYRADAQYEPGTVLEFGGEYEVTIAEDETRRVAGVVSSNPAYLMNSGLTSNYVVAVAFTGRVPTKVRGRVRKGDMMVSAGSGYARPSNDPKMGTVIGKALEDFDGVEGVIEVVVGRY